MQDKKLPKIQAIRGMNDILPPQSTLWLWFEQQLHLHMRRYAFQNIRTPILEQTALFIRSIGEVTDIVEKEMYSFEDRADKNGKADFLSLRPENTAGVVRSAIEHDLTRDGGKRLYYWGPMFRREKPQRGRTRQFHQVGAEILGFPGPEADAEIIALAYTFLKLLGLRDIKLELNTLGQPHERIMHKKALVEYFKDHYDDLDDDAKRRLEGNPLRILDTKNPSMQTLVEKAPKLIDFLEDLSKQYFEEVQILLKAQGIEYSINSRLVRGLDYYNLSVFEFVSDQLGSQGTVCGGGRYDYLFEQMGGKPTPAVGFGLGIERVLDLIQQQKKHELRHEPDLYAIVTKRSDLVRVMPVLQQLREQGLRVQMHLSLESTQNMGSLKSQFRKADASGAQCALIFADDELAHNSVTVKFLRDGQGAQHTEKLENLPQWAQLFKNKFTLD